MQPFPNFPEVFDSTMRSSFVSCPRQFYFSHILGLRKSLSSVHLVFGGAVAAGLETARKGYWADHLTEVEAVAAGLHAVIRTWGDFEPSPDVQSSRAGVKTLDAALDTLYSYFEYFPLGADQLQPVLIDGEPIVEKSFALPVPGTRHPVTGDPILYAGRFDMLACFNEAIFVVDEKTTTSLGPTWRSNWPLRGQLTGYCLTPDHEVLTPFGWRGITTITTDDEIAQWDSGVITFVKPLETFSRDYQGSLVEMSGTISLCATPEHREPVFNVWNNTYKTLTVKEVAYSNNGNYRFIMAGQLEGGKIAVPTDFVRLLVAIQADGSFRLNNGRPHVHFSFTKKRKKLRLENILDSLGIHAKKTDSGTRSDYKIYFAEAPSVQKAFDVLTESKEWGTWLLELPNDRLNVFIEELAYWDGSDRQHRGSLYFTSNKNNADWVQTIAALTGRYSSVHTQQIKPNWKTSYRVVIATDCHKAVVRRKTRQILYDDKVYCLQVPSSYFLVRRNGRISVTGNCWGGRSFSLNISGVVIRGIGVLKGSIQFEQVVLSRPAWLVDQWLCQLARDINRAADLWLDARDRYAADPHLAFDQAFDSACSAYGGCGYVLLCESEDPRPWFDEYQVMHWNPLTRSGDIP